MSFKFELSDGSDTSDRFAGTVKENCCKEIAAIPAKEVFAVRELYESHIGKKTKKYTLGNGKVLLSIPSADVELEIRHSAAAAGKETAVAEALSAETDLLPHVYEGGLKVWECSVDLTDYISTLGTKFEGQRILELGCGSGLPGLYALTEDARAVHFQDYNEEVIQRLTIPNVLLNADERKLGSCRFFSGDWESLKSLLLPSVAETPDAQYDVILTSETIYSPSSYKKLHDVMASLLKPDGVIYLAAKTCYFGVGGGTKEFEEYVRMEGKFDLHVVKEFSDGVLREILKLSLKSSIS